MKSKRIVLVAAAAGVFATAWVAFASQAVVDKRVGGMKSLIGAMRTASSGNEPSVARESLATIIRYAKSIPEQFPKGTGNGDPGISKTRAKQDIWLKPAAFKAEVDAFVAALEAASAAADDRAAYDVAMGSVKKSCSSCHDAFRGPAID
jgi:cytochrome c556